MTAGIATDLISGKLATFGMLLAVLIMLLAGWAAVFNYLHNRHKLRMKQFDHDHGPKVDPWAEAGRRLQVDDQSPDDTDDDNDDGDDDGDVPISPKDPVLSPAAGPLAD